MINRAVDTGSYVELGLDDDAIPRTVDVDLQRTLTDHPHFIRGGKGVQQVKRILLATSVACRSVGYLQGMNYIASFLLLTFMESCGGADGDDGATANTYTNDLLLEEHVYTVLSHLVTDVLPGYFTADLPLLLKDTSILTKLIKATDPGLHKHLQQLGLDLTLLTPQWSLTCFTTGLPWPTVRHILDLLLYTTASKPSTARNGHHSGGAGILLYAQLGILNSCRDIIVETDSMCRAITSIRQKCCTMTWNDITKGAGLSLNSFLDVGTLRREVGRMNRTDMVSGQVKDETTTPERKRSRSEDAGGGGGGDEVQAEAEEEQTTTRSSFTMFATPQAKKRRTALEKFAVKNGIERDDDAGKFLFSAKKGNGLVDAAEGFFKFAQELMTPTPAKAKAKAKIRAEEDSSTNNSNVIKKEDGGDGGEMKEMKTVSFALNKNDNSDSSDKENAGFMSPNRVGFEMTPVKSNRKSTTGKKTKLGRREQTPHRTAHFFTSPTIGGSDSPGLMSPVRAMR
jgi:hypothetical protein